jgi:hypothetical protein
MYSGKKPLGKKRYRLTDKCSIVALGLSGTTMGVIVVDIYRRTHQLAAGYAMISVLLTIIGMVGLSTGIILRGMAVVLCR